MGAEQQSPINLQTDFRIHVARDFLSFHWPADMAGVIVREKDHGVKVAFAVDKNAYVRLRGKTYLLKSFHFHHLSEHWLEGLPSMMELHIVHQNPDDATYCVLGVFLEIDSAARSEAVSAFAEVAKEAAPALQIETDPNEWIPADTSRFHFYEGSLTTAPFTESVSWIVFRAKKGITEKEMIAVIGGNAQDARDLQPLNRRIVLDCVREDSKTAKSNRSLAKSK